jgi:ribosomal protein L24E
MKRILLSFAVAVVALSLAPASSEKKSKTAKEGLQELHDLIGSWKCTGNPLVGSREERDKFWQEKISWKWKFKDKDVWLTGSLTTGKFYSKFELRYLPEKDIYQLKAFRDKEELTFEGKLEKKQLTFERTDSKTKKSERLIFALLHFNRYMCFIEEKPADSKTFTRLYRLGCTKEGVPFASVEKGPECVVSGGLGTMAVTHKGKTYYVCCSGCRDAFRDDPEKYIKEYEEAQKKKKD